MVAVGTITYWLIESAFTLIIILIVAARVNNLVNIFGSITFTEYYGIFCKVEMNIHFFSGRNIKRYKPTVSISGSLFRGNETVVKCFVVI